MASLDLPWVYISGPYSNGDTEQNVRSAIDAAEQVIENLGIPIIPHVTYWWNEIYPHGYEFWLAYDMQLLEGCDVLWRLPGESKGADREVENAKKLGLSIVYSFDELMDYINLFRDVQEELDATDE
jgi:hypothetical protein